MCATVYKNANLLITMTHLRGSARAGGARFSRGDRLSEFAPTQTGRCVLKEFIIIIVLSLLVLAVIGSNGSSSKSVCTSVLREICTPDLPMRTHLSQPLISAIIILLCGLTLKHTHYQDHVLLSSCFDRSRLPIARANPRRRTNYENERERLKTRCDARV